VPKMARFELSLSNEDHRIRGLGIVV